MPLLPAVPLTSQNSALPPFGIDNIKLPFATDKNSCNLGNCLYFHANWRTKHLHPVKYVSLSTSLALVAICCVFSF